MLAFNHVIDALIPEWPPLPPDRRVAVSAFCGRFVSRQIALAPAHIGFGIRVLFAVFYVFAFLRLGLHPLGAVSREQRSKALRDFAFEQIPPFIALERVLRSLTVLAFFDHPDVIAAIGQESSASAAATSPTRGA
jgi:hypothetical protein